MPSDPVAPDAALGAEVQSLSAAAARLLEAGRLEDGLAVLDRALEQDPGEASLWLNKGYALIGLDRMDEAVQAYHRAIALQPEAEQPVAFNELGVYLQRSGQWDGAAASFGKAAALDPSLAEAWANLGSAHLMAGRPAAALPALDRALSLRPRFAEAWINHGMALQWVGRAREALDSFDHAIAAQPDHADAHWNKALALLALGEYAQGWPLFEWRWRRAGAARAPDFGAPLWLGETDLSGKTLLVHTEQGYGDVIQMLRYLPMLTARGVVVKLYAPEPVAELARSVGDVTVAPVLPPLQGFDAQIPMMSLPLAMGARLESIPAAVPYLSAPEAARRSWSARLSPPSGRRRVGLAWSGNPEHHNDRHRSLPFEALAPLLEAGVEFHSLQKDYRGQDLERLRADGRIVDHSAAIASFSDAAALVEQMDLVISADTATAHLAGALGKPLWLLLPFNPDFRWGLESAHTPWYPTARLWRQSAAWDWATVIAGVRAELDA